MDISDVDRERLTTAFNRSAVKQAPRGFASIEAAEAAGWVYDPEHFRWTPPPEVRARTTHLRKRAKGLTDEVVDAMSEPELLAVLEEFEAVPTVEGEKMLRAPELEPGIAGLRARVKHRAALVQAMLKGTSNLEPETSAPQVQLNTQVQSCRMCSRLAPAGKKLLRCARCLAVLYCSSECQKRDWKSHKSFCKMATTQRNDLVKKGGNPAKFNDVLAWAQSVPDLMQHVMSLAWMNRKVQPIVQIKGGVNARMAQVEVYPLEKFKKAPEAAQLGFEARFAQPDFHTDTHYFVIIWANHEGTEDWPVPTPRFKFPLPPDKMDVVAPEIIARVNRKFEADLRAGGPAAPTPAAPTTLQGKRVRLAGLRATSLNGQMGVCGAFDAAKERWPVTLDSGRVVLAREVNIEAS